MNTSDVVRIGGGQAYYNEGLGPLGPLLAEGMDYIVCDGLAEFTLAKMQRERQADPMAGYDMGIGARVAAMAEHLGSRRTKLITNGGGVNPAAAKQHVLETCRANGLEGLVVATVSGDDVMDRRAELGITGEVLFANIYLGAAPIARALDDGADIVLTGRVADASLFLAPLIHEFGWDLKDWDRMATGIVLGHLMECSSQVTGGNYTGDWWNTGVDLHEVAFPYAEVHPDGTAILSKPAASGGRVSFDTVREQLLYEVHDPSAYLNPDVTADFTSVQLADVGPNRVRLSGIRGREAPQTLKGLVCRPAGWCGEFTMTYSWPDAEAKVRTMMGYLRDRSEAIGVPVLEWCEELFGLDGLGGPTAEAFPDGFEPPEIVGRLAWRTPDEASAWKLRQVVRTIGVGGPPHYVWIGHGGLPAAVTEKLSVEGFFVDRALIEDLVEVSLEVA
jgi:hypothetical protein